MLFPFRGLKLDKFRFKNVEILASAAEMVL